MSTALCLVISVLVTALGGVALWVGLRNDTGGMQAKVGGACIVVIGVVGLVACLASA